MLLVYTHKITPRLRYTFKHFFESVLGINVVFTTKLQVFIAQNGPKLSYTNTPLGNEFFVSSNPLLFEQGVRDLEIQIREWEGLPVFFECSQASFIPFDFFAATFYLMSRYEEYLLHVKDENGRFMSNQCLAVQNNFIEQPIIDLWANRLLQMLRYKFPELETEELNSNQFIPLIEVVSPYKYIHKSFLRNIAQFFITLSKLQLWNIIEQLMVLLGFWKDPWNNFNSFTKLFKESKLKPRFFFLFSNITYLDQGISIFNTTFHSLIKSVADYHKVSLLVSTEARQKAKKFKLELESFESVIHHNTKFIKFNIGVTSVFETYRNVLAMEEAEDFSLGYHDKIGYRASTAVPFRFFDLGNEIETALILYPLVASEEVLRTTGALFAFEKLKQIKDQIPTPSGVHVFSVTNAILSSHNSNKSWREGYVNYINSYGR
tara:strand:+ start:5676 stop:6974 length:1299 start_codon:yes stop_codon:yes gene_type:complete